MGLELDTVESCTALLINKVLTEFPPFKKRAETGPRGGGLWFHKSLREIFLRYV